MAAKRGKLKVQERSETGSRAARRLRREGLVPGVVYAGKEGPKPFKVDAREVRAVLGEGHALFDLELDGSGAVPVVVKEQQHDPVRGGLEHLDLQRVRLDEKIQSTVPVAIENADSALGVREGGILEHVTRELTVSSLPTDIPDQIPADVIELNIGDNLTLGELSPPEEVEFLDDPDTVIATLTAPRIEEEPEPEAEEEAELVGEEGEEVPAEEGEEAEGEGAPAPAEGSEEG